MQQFSVRPHAKTYTCTSHASVHVSEIQYIISCSHIKEIQTCANVLKEKSSHVLLSRPPQTLQDERALPAIQRAERTAASCSRYVMHIQTCPHPIQMRGIQLLNTRQVCVQSSGLMSVCLHAVLRADVCQAEAEKHKNVLYPN